MERNYIECNKLKPFLQFFFSLKNVCYQILVIKIINHELFHYLIVLMYPLKRIALVLVYSCVRATMDLWRMNMFLRCHSTRNARINWRRYIVCERFLPNLFFFFFFVVPGGVETYNGKISNWWWHVVYMFRVARWFDWNANEWFENSQYIRRQSGNDWNYFD